MIGCRLQTKQRIRERNAYRPTENQKMLGHRPSMYSDRCIGLNPTMKFPGDVIVDEQGNKEVCK